MGNYRKRKWQQKQKKDHENKRKKRRLQEVEFIEELIERVQAEAPPVGVNILALDAETCEEREIIVPLRFEDLPITKETQRALKANKFVVLRDIQKASLPHALAGRDVLGAARTGSGKTLCYVIPLLETLYRARWNVEDALGGLVICPTRELATQIFEVLRKVGVHHRFSAGLIMGGKKMDGEKKRILGMNILVATPGRLLAHMEETYGFHADNLQILILDEADRILDMGFQHQIESIMENLPSSRQTLLFSATLSKSVSKLARLSLNRPQYIKCLEETDAKPTPKKLIESYIVTKEEDKFNFLWTFIRTHVKQKIMVFMTTRKQVRFTYEIVRKMQPGCPVKHTHGKMCQPKRMATYYDFNERKGGCVFFTTAVASRGLDFPNVDWVLLYDCPSDTQSYVHSVGRTARNFAKGNSLLVLLPFQLAFLKRLETKRIKPKKMVIKSEKLQNITGTVRSLVAENRDFKYLGERAFVSYYRSLCLEKDKEVFDASELDSGALTRSMGLPGTPQISGTNVTSKSKMKNMSYAMQELMGVTKKKKRADTYVDRLLSKKSTGVFSEHRRALRAEEEDEEDEDDFFQAVGGDDGNIEVPDAPKKPPVSSESKEEDSEKPDFAEEVKKFLNERDLIDKEDDRERVREKHQKVRWAERDDNRLASQGEALPVIIGRPSGSEDEEDEESSEDSNESDLGGVEDLEKQALELANA